jgi:hypothetical protein
LEYLFVREIERPPVGSEDRLIEAFATPCTPLQHMTDHS